MTLTQYWDEAEADFQRFYGLDLRREVDRVGVRRLYALVKNLPPDAALWRAQEAEKPKPTRSQNGDTTTLRTSDPETIHEFFNAAFS